MGAAPSLPAVTPTAPAGHGHELITLLGRKPLWRILRMTTLPKIGQKQVSSTPRPPYTVSCDWQSSAQLL
jgi:hypothetical protein